MKPKLVALNLVLLSLVAATVWQGRVRWEQAQQLRKATLNVHVKAVSPPPMASVPEPQTPSAIQYADVAKKNLFSADRNDDIVVDPPKIVAPKQMPPLPTSTGVMRMPSGVRAFMAEKPGQDPKLVKVNDMVGDFKIVALDEHDVTFEWDGQEIKRKIEDLIDRSNHQAVAANSQPQSGAPAAPPPQGPAPAPPLPPGQKSGAVFTETQKLCRPGDPSPAGTVEDGYRKDITNSIFGPVCRWVKQ